MSLFRRARFNMVWAFFCWADSSILPPMAAATPNGTLYCGCLKQARVGPALPEPRWRVRRQIERRRACGHQVGDELGGHRASG